MYSPLYFLTLGHADWQAVLSKTAPAGAEEFSRYYVELVHARNFDEALKETDARHVGKDNDQAKVLSEAADFFPKGEIKSVKLVGVNILKDDDGSTKYHLLFEYEFTDRWIGVETVLSQSGSYLVETLTAWVRPDSVEHLNRFTFQGKGYMHYMIMGLAVLLLFFNLTVFIRALLKPDLKNKWLWCVFILVGLMQVCFNWTTGQFALMSSYDRQTSLYDYFYIGLPVVQFFQMPYGPLVIRFSLPIGAMLFLSRYPLRKR